MGFADVVDCTIINIDQGRDGSGALTEDTDLEWFTDFGEGLVGGFVITREIDKLDFSRDTTTSIFRSYPITPKSTSNALKRRE